MSNQGANFGRLPATESASPLALSLNRRVSFRGSFQHSTFAPPPRRLSSSPWTLRPFRPSLRAFADAQLPPALPAPSVRLFVIFPSKSRGIINV